MTWTFRHISALLLPLLVATRGLAAPCDGPAHAPGDLGIDLSQQDQCDPLVPEHCLLPFPNDYHSVLDGSTKTHRRLHFVADALPKNTSGTPMDANELNQSDGFSPGSALLMWMPTADLALSGTPPITDIESSLAPDSPIVIVDTNTGRRWPFWTELDLLSPEGSRTIIVRPAVNFLETHRYVVGVRGLVDGASATIAPSPAFAAYRDGICTTDATFEARRAHMENVFKILKGANVERGDLQLAWDFTVASSRSLAGRMLHIRDDAFGWLGRNSPQFSITSVQENPATEFRRRIKGTFQVPLYLTGNGGPGNRFAYGADGRPQRQSALFVATFTCNLPNYVDATPARMSLYGHGLLGDQGEVNGSLVRRMSQTYNVAYCATDFIGMADEDTSNAISILLDLSKFPSLADRLQQGLLNNLFLGRLMRHPQGFASDPAFLLNGAPLIDTDELYYDGNSQGAILGGSLCAVARDFRRCVLGEAGMNYSTLLNRSVDFDLYKIVLDMSYPDPFVQLVSLNLIQIMWDRGETNGYAQHLTRSAYPRTPRHTVLLLGAVGDHQVSEFALQVEARTMGAAGHVPYVGPGREFGGEHGWGITPIPAYPWPRSAYFLWDTGATLSPLENTAPRDGHDPHDDTPKIPAVQALKDGFWHRAGVVNDVCAGAPCTGPQF
jgi:hypothetical protein